MNFTRSWWGRLSDNARVAIRTRGSLRSSLIRPPFDREWLIAQSNLRKVVDRLLAHGKYCCDADARFTQITSVVGRIIELQK